MDFLFRKESVILVLKGGEIMNISGYLSNQLRQVLEKDEKLNIIKSQGIIPLLNYKDKYEKGFYNPKKLLTIEDIEVNGDVFIVDFFEELNGFNGILGAKVVKSVFSEQKENNNVKKFRIRDIYFGEIPDKEKEEALRVFLNHVVKKSSSTKIILINLIINNEYRIVNGEKKLFNDKQKVIVERLNNSLSFYINTAKKINNCIKILDLEVFLTGVKNELVFQDNSKKIIQNIKGILKNSPGFKGELIYSSELPIKYYYEKASKLNKNKLLVVFSAFSFESAKYNYITSLKKIDCNKLFILDDYGGRGCYYLGLDGRFDVETSVMSLITSKMVELDINFKDVIMSGSSKGGSAAMYLGLKYNIGNIIAGAPQYMIGTYLCQLTAKEHAQKIFGEISEGTRIKYDNLIKFAASTNTNSRVQIISGEGDTQYRRVLKAFEVVAKEYNLDFTMTMCDIKSHSDISKVYPGYLIDKLGEILEVKNLSNIGIDTILKICKSY